VAKRVVHDRKFAKRSSATLAAETTFYTTAMIGLTTSGYLAKFDDTQSMIFVGLVRGGEGDPVLPAGTQGDAALGLDYEMPDAFELAISGVTVAHIGRKVYALDDQTGTLASTTTYGNLVGTVIDVVATGIALVQPAYDGIAANKRLGAARVLAAIGNQSLTKFDLNKTIFLPNTVAYTVTLPAIADTQAGDELHFVKNTAAAFAVTLDGNAAETIDGAATYAAIDANYDCAVLVSTGTEWVIKNRDIA
jgi:hypothetical protein